MSAKDELVRFKDRNDRTFRAEELPHAPLVRIKFGAGHNVDSMVLTRDQVELLSIALDEWLESRP